jgi:hypothetical protein
MYHKIVLNTFIQIIIIIIIIIIINLQNICNYEEYKFERTEIQCYENLHPCPII